MSLKNFRYCNYRCENNSNILKSKLILISMIRPCWDKRKQSKLKPLVFYLELVFQLDFSL